MVSTITRDLTLMLESVERKRSGGREKGRTVQAGKPSSAAIQILRAAAMLCVFLFHFSGFAAPNAGDGLGEFLIVLFARIGSLGTDCFLVVSGALAWLSYDRSRPTWLDFVARRARRLYPPFLAWIGVYIVLSALFPSQSKFPPGWGDSIIYLLRNLVMVPGIFPARPIITVSWTLTLIFAFYLIIPPVGRMLEKVTPGGRRSMPLVLSALGVGWMLLCTAFPVLPGRAMFLIAGCALSAQYLKEGRGRDWMSPIGAIRFGAICLLVRQVLAMQQVVGPLVLLGFEVAGLVSLTNGCLRWRVRDGVEHSLVSKGLQVWGNMGYSFYLAHGLSLKFIFIVVAPTLAGIVGPWQLVPVALLTAFTAGTLLFRFVEQPGQWPWMTIAPQVTSNEPPPSRDEQDPPSPPLRAMAAKA